MTWLVERLADLRRYLDHLRKLRPRVIGPQSLDEDFSLRNDVLHSLLMVCQLVIDIAGELAARRGERFEDYVGAVRALARDSRFSSELVARLEPLPGFRNVLVHEYVTLDLQRVVDALDRLDPIDQFLDVVIAIEGSPEDAGN
jgi:uncharacterized protein YutE (UPF0331/DUF86 family)